MVLQYVPILYQHFQDGFNTFTILSPRDEVDTFKQVFIKIVFE